MAASMTLEEVIKASMGKAGFSACLTQLGLMRIFLNEPEGRTFSMKAEISES